MELFGESFHYEIFLLLLRKALERYGGTLHNVLAKQVKHFKETEGGRKEMCKLVEDYADQKAAQVAAQAEEQRIDTLHEAIKNAMDSFHITLAQAMDGLKISEADRAVLSKRF